MKGGQIDPPEKTAIKKRGLIRVETSRCHAKFNFSCECNITYQKSLVIGITKKNH